MVFGASLAIACSALNPEFDVDRSTTSDTDLPITTSTSTGVDATEESSSGLPPDVAEVEVCVPPLVEMIEKCLHVAELSKPMETDFEPGEFFRHPVKSDLLPFCTFSPGGLATNQWSGDAYLSTLVGDGVGIDPAEAYFDTLCASDDYEWCAGTVEEFRATVMQSCFEDFNAGFELPMFMPGANVAAQLEEIRQTFLTENCPIGECNLRFELYEIPRRVAPTTGGDAVRELLGSYLLGGTMLVVERYDEGFYEQPPFAIPYGELQSLVGDQGWIVVTFEAYGPYEDCPAYQNFAFIAIQHELHLLVKMVRGQCTM